MTSADVGMTSPAGASGFDVDGHRASDRELRSTCIPLDVGDVVPHATSGPAAHGTTASSDIAGPPSFSWREHGGDDRVIQGDDSDKSFGHRQAATAFGDDVTRSQNNDEGGTVTGSRQNSAGGFGSSERSASTAVSSSHMHLRSKTSRDSQLECEVVDASTTCRERRRRTRDVCRPLRHWMYGHRDAPYPSRADKLQLATATQLSLTQISNWFANARRRLKNTVDRAVARPLTDVHDTGLDWAQRIRLYNRHTVGNQEQLSISSDDSDRDDELDDVTGSHDDDVATKYAGGETARTTTTTGGLPLGDGDRLELIITPSDVAGAGGCEEELERQRHRSASGSLSSHDYEEMSTSSASLRSTPTYASHPLHLAHSPRLAVDFEDCADYSCCNSSDRAGVYDGAMHWKEISAALALTTLANSRLNNRQT